MKMLLGNMVLEDDEKLLIFFIILEFIPDNTVPCNIVLFIPLSTCILVAKLINANANNATSANTIISDLKLSIYPSSFLFILYNITVPAIIPHIIVLPIENKSP